MVSGGDDECRAREQHQTGHGLSGRHSEGRLGEPVQRTRCKFSRQTDQGGSIERDRPETSGDKAHTENEENVGQDGSDHRRLDEPELVLGQSDNTDDLSGEGEEARSVEVLRALEDKRD